MPPIKAEIQLAKIVRRSGNAQARHTTEASQGDNPVSNPRERERERERSLKGSVDDCRAESAVLRAVLTKQAS